MRKRGYKKNFLTPIQCPAFSQYITEKMTPFWKKWDEGLISSAELTAHFIEESIQFIQPSNWASRRRNPSLAGQRPCLQFGFRGIPESAHQSLEAWLFQKYPLVLFVEVPDVQTVLKLQSEGKRCVSVIRDPQLINHYILGERDAFSFTIHDLIHADHFFSDPRQMYIQIGFSRFMKVLAETSMIQQALHSNLRFNEQFEYAASDMNSHGAHLCKYLKAILQQHGLFDQVADILPWNYQKIWQEHFERLSTPQENIEVLKALELFCWELGQKKNNPEKIRVIEDSNLF